MLFNAASAGVCLILLLWLVPQWQVNQLPVLDQNRLQQLPITDQLQLEREETYRRAQLEGKQRDTLLLVILGLLGAWGHTSLGKITTDKIEGTIFMISAKQWSCWRPKTR